MGSKVFTSAIRVILLSFIFLFLFYPDKLGIKFDFAGAPLTDSKSIRIAKVVFWLLLLIEVLRMFYYSVVKTKAKGWMANLVTIFVPVFAVAVGLEIVFMFVPQSHEGVLSKASQIWWTNYWKPINSLGFRDKEVDSVSKKKTVIVVGDSYAAGHGLENVTQRFSDILESKLGPDKYIVYNLGVSGADTRDEAKRLINFPVKPDIIVLQYFLNDVEKVGREKGLSLKGSETYSDLTGPLATIVKRFYLPNFIYWQLPHTQFSTFEQFVSSSYRDTTVLNAHLRDLSQMIRYRDSTASEMYAVMIPFAFQLEKSEELTRPVEDYFIRNGVKVITLTKEMAGIPEKERIVGKNDAHASAKVNSVIAEKLYETIRK